MRAPSTTDLFAGLADEHVKVADLRRTEADPPVLKPRRACQQQPEPRAGELGELGEHHK